MEDQVKFTNKLMDAKVLIIGGSSGIGYAVAEAVLENQGQVIISSSNPSRVEQAISRLQASYPSASTRVFGHTCDLSDETTLESNVIHLFEKVGQVDHVVFTAGDTTPMKGLADSDFRSMKQMGMVRFFGAMMVGKHASRYLTEGPNSSITFTTGVGSFRPIPNRAVIESFAAGLHGFTRGLALDLKPIRVNLVSSGAVDTELWASRGMSDEQKQKMFEGYQKSLPTGRVATPDAVAEAYMYLMKDTNVTGTIVSTEGGTLLVG